jgi:hypothetical protein
VNQVLTPARLFEIYPFKELMLFAFLSAMIRLHENAQIEAKSTSDNPGTTAETKLKKANQCNLTTSKKGSTLKVSETCPSPGRTDAAEFMSLPPQMREQLLRYGERWRAGLSR